MIRKLCSLVAVLSLSLSPAAWADTASDRLKVIGSDVLSGAMADYCVQAAPARKAAIATAYQGWRTRSQIDRVRSALGKDELARADAAFAAKNAEVQQDMARRGSADTVCAQVPVLWDAPSFNMQAEYPAAYAENSPAAPVQAAAPVKTVAVPAAPKSGHGLDPRQIETVVSSFEQGYVGINFQLTEKAYLLLKDGTARRDLPTVGPSDFDIAADKAANPGNWGRWTKRNGAYVFRFAGDSDFSGVPGEEVHTPAQTGLSLTQGYHSASGYTILGGAGSYSFHSLTFSAAGRFTRANTGFTGGSIGIGPTTVAAGTAWDDKGSATTVTGQGAAVRGGSVSNTGTTDADLQGRYHIDGYQLDLVYDSGRRESHFFYVTADRKLIGFDNGTMIVRH